MQIENQSTISYFLLEKNPCVQNNKNTENHLGYNLFALFAHILTEIK